MSEKKNNLSAKYVKSSAALTTLIIHAVLIVTAVSLVAVTVIKKDESRFDVKTVQRPRMKMKKLQVPVKVNKKRQVLKLRKRIVVKPNLDRKMPEIKMPEISGLKGGLGSAGTGGFGAGSAIGFSVPEIDLFGITGRGEKIFIILDASPGMLTDIMGGIPAYELIKTELLRILEEIGPLTVFNIAVFEGQHVHMLFPEMVSANSESIEKVRNWIVLLNKVSKGMGNKDYGVKTLGPGDQVVDSFAQAGEVSRQRTWLQPAMIANRQKADMIFLLTNSWGPQTKIVGSKGMSRDDWYETEAGKEWVECFEKGKKMLAEENRKRREDGQPPRVVGDSPVAINNAFFPDIERPPGDKIYHYEPRDIAEAFQLVRKQDAVQKKNRAEEFSFNVIHFVPADGSTDGGYKSTGNFNALAGQCNGDYNTVKGLAAIESYITARDIN